MKNRKNILFVIANRRFQRRLKSKRKKKARRRNHYLALIESKELLRGDKSTNRIYENLLPVNLAYILNCEKSDFHLSEISKDIPENKGNFLVPVMFSIVEYPKESYKFIKELLGALLIQKYETINIDYSQCKKLDLGAQVFLDILLIDIIKYFERCERLKKKWLKVSEINAINMENEYVKKLLFSVGSPVIHSNTAIKFTDIISSKLCIHDREAQGDPQKIRERKDLDTTNLVTYVLDCLKTLNRTLTPDRLDDLSTVIGEILINAEEHSTTKHRFSIGYFHEINNNGKHFGVFRLTILNFGKTIYEKFKDPECPNKSTVLKMKSLSERYTKKKMFVFKNFEEETLWTLYSLQEGVTSVNTDEYLRRGNGSIQFIESFFNIKGTTNEKDNFSSLAILSGNSKILFDGTYNITSNHINGDEYKLMTFNHTGRIEDKPDTDFVQYTDNYFPGTIISAKILFNEDDFTKEA